ncbi:MAG TPA: PfkB family carbohydrate kinase [Armatimonadota bacterium]|jgi:rfaE bifunctional protein kinase chain/domain
MTRHRLEEILGALPGVSIAVVGDFFLDRYLVMDPALTEVSLETGLDAFQVVGKRNSPGAAGTVTSNLRALGVGTLLALGVVGEDGEGYDLRRGLEAGGVDATDLLTDAGLFTPTYIKPMFRHPDGSETESNRQDIKNRTPLSPELEGHLVRRLRQITPSVDGVIIADQVQERNCGVVTDAVREELSRLGRQHPDKVFFADSRVRIGEFRDVICKPNRLEAAQALDPSVTVESPRSQAQALGQALFERTGRPLYLTLSHEGMLLFTQGGCTHLPAFPVTGPTDPVGAGDSCTAGIVSALCAGATLEEAGLVGNLVASITVQKLGTTGTASPGELLAALPG